MNLSRNPKVLLYVAAVLIALVLIMPHPTESGWKSNLKYGLDLEGGSWLQLQLEGCIVKVDADPKLILQKQFPGSTVVQQGDSYAVTMSGNMTPGLPEKLGYAGSPVAQRGNVTKVTIPASTELIVSNYLKSALKADVQPVTLESLSYEIRANVTREQVDAVLAEVGGSIAPGENSFMPGVTPATVEQTKKILDTKLNRLGLQDIKVRVVGNQFILIDMAGVDVATAQEIVGKPGKFEIRIQTRENQTEHVVYGDAVVTVEIPRKDREQWGVPFSLSESGAETLRKSAVEAGATKNPKAHELSMYLDQDMIYSAPLAPDLAASLNKAPVRELIANVGTGDEGSLKAKELEIHLRAGALPVNVKIIGSGQIPAALGAQFKFQIFIGGLLALVAVGLMVFWRYRVRRIVLPLVGTSFSEVVMLLGVYSLAGWQLDLAAIAGAITVIGTGVDHLVIITDRLMRGSGSMPSKSEGKYAASGGKLYERRIVEILGIIIGAAATTVAAMLPLFGMGFGSLTGFALTVIIGVFIGVGIARPAYASVADYILGSEAKDANKLKAKSKEALPDASDVKADSNKVNVESASKESKVQQSPATSAEKAAPKKKAPKKKGARKDNKAAKDEGAGEQKEGGSGEE